MVLQVIGYCRFRVLKITGYCRLQVVFPTQVNLTAHNSIIIARIKRNRIARDSPQFCPTFLRLCFNFSIIFNFNLMAHNYAINYRLIPFNNNKFNLNFGNGIHETELH